MTKNYDMKLLASSTVEKQATEQRFLTADNALLKPSKKKMSENLVERDTFSMPKSDYERIEKIIKATLQVGMSCNKSEVVRAGLHLLCALSPGELKRTMSNIERVKTGRKRL